MPKGQKTGANDLKLLLTDLRAPIPKLERKKELMKLKRKLFNKVI